MEFNHSKDDGDFLDNVFRAVRNSEDFEKAMNLQKHLSKQTVTFTPKFTKRGSMKCSRNHVNSKELSANNGELLKAIKSISTDNSLIGNPESLEFQVPKRITERCIVQKILKVFTQILSDLKKDIIPCLKVQRQRSWVDVTFTKDRVTPCSGELRRTTKIICNSKKSKRFEFTLWILGKIVDLIAFDKMSTKRELYYQMKDHFQDIAVEQVEGCINFISVMLDCPPWDFHILATNRGIVHGDLVIIFENGDQLNCSITGGVTIPQDLCNIKKIETDASFILVVEKDAIFQELLKQDLSQKLNCNLIMITGKGYSDTSTRFFLKKVWQIACIPAFILVDCDPYGIDIMLHYRFGSVSQAHLADDLALPQLRWFGVYPSEIVTLKIKTLPLSKRDTCKINSMLTRPYISAVPTLKRELEILLEKGVKASIEGSVKGNNYMSDYYLPMKFSNKDFV